MLRKEQEIQSLNQGLTALYAEELEQRLETDPLGLGGLLSELSDVAPLSICEGEGVLYGSGSDDICRGEAKLIEV